MRWLIFLKEYVNAQNDERKTEKEERRKMYEEKNGIIQRHG